MLFSCALVGGNAAASCIRVRLESTGFPHASRGPWSSTRVDDTAPQVATVYERVRLLDLLLAAHRPGVLDSPADDASQEGHTAQKDGIRKRQPVAFVPRVKQGKSPCAGRGE